MPKRHYVNAKTSNRVFKRASMNRKADKVKLYRSGQRIV